MTTFTSKSKKASGSRPDFSARRRCRTRLVIVPGQIGVIAKFPESVSVGWKALWNIRLTNLGLMRWATMNKAPSSTQIPPTTTYAIPRNGFFPPITVRVEITIDLVPPYSVTLKSRICQHAIHKGRFQPYNRQYRLDSCQPSLSGYRFSTPVY